MLLSKSKIRAVALTFIVLFLSEIVTPTALMALSGGPSQPEFGSFAQASTTDMVDLFTGDFKYNIPLIEIDGYPLTLNYNGGVSMEQEASWVGLGWNLSPGLINRSVRGIPDDFKGKKIVEKYNLKDQYDVSIGGNFLFELFGKEGLIASQKNSDVPPPENGSSSGESTNVAKFLTNLKELLTAPEVAIDLTYNTQKGFFINVGSEFAFKKLSPVRFKWSLGGGGINLAPTLTSSGGLYDYSEEEVTGSLGLSCGVNSRTGLQNFSVNMDYQRKKDVAAYYGKKISELGASIPLTNSGYFPGSVPQFKNRSFSFNIKLGLALTTFDGDIGARGSFSRQSLANKNKESRAFGYLYSQNSDNEEDLKDFNRDGDIGSYYEGMHHLAPAQWMPDVFNIAAQGLSESIRPFRAENGAVSDPSEKLLADFGLDVGVELAITTFPPPAPPTIKGGADVTVNTNKFIKTPWEDVEEAYANFDGNPKNTLEENIYWKAASDMTATAPEFVNGLQDDHYIKFGLTSNTQNTINPSALEPRNTFASTNSFQRTIKNNPIRVLYGKEAVTAAFDETIRNYTTEDLGTSINRPDVTSNQLQYSTIPRVDAVNRTESEISEIVSYKGGARYVFGIPALNLTQKEVTFSANDAEDPTGSLINYSATDASTSNSNGEDKYFYSKETPAYAHSYLLTSYLGEDYVDVTGDGISDDDLGTAVRFNWTRKHDNFRWKSPFGAYKAHFQEGSRLTNMDNKGSYTSGTKEIWYPHSIESRNHILIFFTEDRCDGLGNADEHGTLETGINIKRQQKLTKIMLFNKQAYLSADGDLSNLEPIKTILFEYDYSLCKGVPNFSALNGEEPGKLTLKKIEIIQGGESEVTLSPYIFHYPTSAEENPDYTTAHADRWGTYRTNVPPNFSDDPWNYSYTNYKSSSSTLEEYYDEQNLSASAWMLNEITLPSGGEISIKYEADDYAYVQNLKACEMFQVSGFSDSSDGSNLSTELHKKTAKSSLNNKYLIINNPYSGSVLPSDFDPRSFLEGQSHLYYKMDVTLPSKAGQSEESGNSEFIRGYAEYGDVGFCDPGARDKIYVEIKPLDYKKNKLINPILKATLDYINLHHQSMIFGNFNPDDGAIEKFLNNIVAIKDDLISLFAGPYGTMMVKNMGRDFDPEKSFVKLNHPLSKKIGGGYRVQRIEISDMWDAMTSGDDYKSTYGQEYIYTDEEGKSSGVASFEPSMGNDENPFKRVEGYYKVGETPKFRPSKPGPEMFQEGPIGELFFPSAVVGYSKVQVKSIHYGMQKKSARKLAVHHFYTAKDYPFKVNSSKLQEETDELKLGFLAIFTGSSYKEDFRSTTQSFVLEFNDMHGKPKAEEVFLQLEDNLFEQLSGAYYSYKDDQKGNLKSKVKAIDRYGILNEQQLMGVDVEVCLDSKNTINRQTTLNTQGNLSSFVIPIVPPIPLCIPFIWPSFRQTVKEYRTATITKVVNRKGIIDEIEYFDKGLKTKLTNDLYDAHTAAVIESTITTAFDNEQINTTAAQTGRRDKIISKNYPAYWAKGLNRMGHAYQNEGYRGDVYSGTNEYFQFISATEYQDLVDNNNASLVDDLIYKSFLDGLIFCDNCAVGNSESPSGYYDGLKGNFVQEGIFQEGDEVVSLSSGNRTTYFAAEVLTEAEVNDILELVSEEPILPFTTWNSNEIPIEGANVGQGMFDPETNWVVLCQDAEGTTATKNQLVAATFQEILSLSNNLSSATTGNISASLPLADSYSSTNSDVSTFFSQMEAQDFYDIWDSEEQQLFELYQAMLTDAGVRTLLASLRNSQDEANAFKTVLTCEPVLACLYNSSNNTIFIDALKALAKHDYRSSLISYLADNFDDHFIINTLDANQYCVPEGPSGLTCITPSGETFMNHFYTYSQSTPCTVPQNTPCATSYPWSTIFDVSAAYSTVNSVTASSFLAGSGCSLNNPETDIFTSTCTSVNQVNELNMVSSCETDVVSSSQNNSSETEITEEYQDFPYNEPEGRELVMFIDRSGAIVDLSGHELLITRSGRRNLIAVSVGEVQIHENDGTTKGLLSASATNYKETWASDFHLREITTTNSDEGVDHKFNPFIYGNRGIWRPYMSLTPLTDRTQNQILKTELEGSMPLTLAEFYWQQDNTSLNQLSVADNTDVWVSAEKITAYSGLGSPVESKNALDIYSTMALSDFNAVVAEANNAQNREILFESFELYPDLSGVKTNNELRSREFETSENGNSYATPTVTIEELCLEVDDSHSGLSSIFIDGSSSPNSSTVDGIQWSIPLNRLNVANDNYDSEYYNLSGFMPLDNKAMILSLWVKSAVGKVGKTNYTTTYDALNETSPSKVVVDYFNSTGASIHTETLNPKGAMIDGWQKIEDILPAVSGAVSIRIRLEADLYGAFFDDLRIHPLHSNMKTYVYDPESRRILAILDENNYATFYKYDIDGSLMKVERETEQGRVTVKENIKRIADFN